MIGADLSLWWGIPFAGLLLSIAILPLVAHDLWHGHYGKIALAWVLALLVPFTFSFGTDLALHEVAHVVLAEYLPFIIVLFALFTISGGICLRGECSAATPARNTGLLSFGAALASVMGTTGASMLLIRPLLTAEPRPAPPRPHGGVLHPAGGKHRGRAVAARRSAAVHRLSQGCRLLLDHGARCCGPTLFLTATLLGLFYVVDRRLFAASRMAVDIIEHSFRVRLEGTFNLVLLAGVVGAVLLSGLWKPDVSFDVLGTPVALQNVVRDGLLIGAAFVSLAGHTEVGIRGRATCFVGADGRGGQAVRLQFSSRSSP